MGLLEGGERLREAVLEGLVASIGGLDGSLAQAASSALISWLRAPGLSPGTTMPDPMGFDSCARCSQGLCPARLVRYLLLHCFVILLADLLVDPSCARDAASGALSGVARPGVHRIGLVSAGSPTSWFCNAPNAPKMQPYRKTCAGSCLASADHASALLISTLVSQSCNEAVQNNRCLVAHKFTITFLHVPCLT